MMFDLAEHLGLRERDELNERAAAMRRQAAPRFINCAFLEDENFN